MCGNRGRCPDCDSGILSADGRCKYCHGSGINCNLASEVPQCLFCKGTGVCQTCDGKGAFSAFDEFEDKGTQKLFE